MKATGIVRRIEECVIIGQTVEMRINTRVLLVCITERIGVKIGFLGSCYT